MIVAAHEDIAKGKGSKLSPISWKSHVLKRVTNCTLSSEAMAQGEGCGELEWVIALWEEATDKEFDLKKFKNKRSVDSLSGIQTNAKRGGLLITDCKSLYDTLNNHGTSNPKDKRTTIELRIIKDDMRTFGHDIRWVPTEMMLVDCFTKRKHGGAELIRVLKGKDYVLQSEGKSLEDKKDKRDKRKVKKGENNKVTEEQAEEATILYLLAVSKRRKKLERSGDPGKTREVRTCQVPLT